MNRTWQAYGDYITALVSDYADHRADCDHCNEDKLCTTGQSLYDQVQMVEPADVVVQMKKKLAS